MSEMKKKSMWRWVWAGIPGGVLLLGVSCAAAFAGGALARDQMRLEAGWFDVLCIISLIAGVAVIFTSIVADVCTEIDRRKEA